MVQMKPYFLGEAVPSNPRMASCQKCFRTSDIDLVGDATHLTFFEMLGNFSVGDYFKEETINWAYEFITQRLELPPERIWATIFLDDDESFNYWLQTGVPEDRILRFDEEENFWGPVGDSGPCGPDTEVFYDFGEEYGCGKPDCNPNCDCGRFTEIATLVFMQYDQDKDGKRTPLPSPCVDTGMGIERTSAVLQGKTTVYETDLFAPLIEKISALAGKKYGDDETADNAIRIIAEHSRGITFLIADGVMPGNEGRGYVLRRLLRRAALYGRRLGLEKPFLNQIARATVGSMANIYPELQNRQGFIYQVVEAEETKFQETLNTGLELIEGITAGKTGEISGEDVFRLYDTYGFPVELTREMASDRGFTVDMDGFEREMEKQRERARVAQKFKISNPVLGEVNVSVIPVFTWDTINEVVGYQFTLGRDPTFAIIDTVASTTMNRYVLEEPLEYSNTYYWRVRGVINEPVYAARRVVTKGQYGPWAVGVFTTQAEPGEPKPSMITIKKELAEIGGTSYNNLRQKSTILSLLVNDDSVDTVQEGQEAGLVLADTPFYGEMGGQVGDTGEIRGPAGRFTVTDTIRIPPDIIVHQGKVAGGSFTVGDEVEAEVDIERRLDIARNHTATHLLQAALRQVLGDHIQQRGSLVAPERFRFDFSHLVAMTPDEISEVQRIVNENIRRDLPVYDETIPHKQAIEEGAIALFDEKYSDMVRVLRIGRPPVSAELCGGTHVNTTGEIGFFQILSESSIGAGLRRIEAVTGRGAEEYINRRLSDVFRIAGYLETETDEVVEKTRSLLEDLKNETRRAGSLEVELAGRTAESLLSQVETVNGVNVLAAKVKNSRIEVLREMSDVLREKLKSVIVVLGSVYEDKPVFIAAVTRDLVDKGYNAGEIVKQVAKVTGGGGGGKAEIAQAGGRQKEKLDEALRQVTAIIKNTSVS